MSLLRNIKTIVVQKVSTFFPKETIFQSKNKWNVLAEENAQFHVLTKGKGSQDMEAFREEGKRDVEAYVLQDTFLRERLGVLSELRVLEVGCGIGRLTEYIAQHVKEVVGIDIAEGMVEKASNRLKDIPNIRFVAVDGVTYPFEDQSFDFVFSFIVFQHMPSVEVIQGNIAEIARVLKKGGLAKIQIRGTPIAKDSLYYGPHFNIASARKLIEGTALNLVKTEGEGKKYFWLYLEKR